MGFGLNDCDVNKCSTKRILVQITMMILVMMTMTMMMKINREKGGEKCCPWG